MTYNFYCCGMGVPPALFGRALPPIPQICVNYLIRAPTKCELLLVQGEFGAPYLGK
jgi:hypothetical protein